MLWGIDWRVVQRMLIDTVDLSSDKENEEPEVDEKGEIDLSGNIEVNDDNIEAIMKGLEKYK